MPPTVATSPRFPLTLHLPLPLGPAMHVADCPCTAICAQQQQQQLLQQTATVGRRVISSTQTQSVPSSPLSIHRPAPSPTSAVFYLSVGSRHSQLPFRIELNSNFYQFTKATAGESKEKQPGCQCGFGSGAELWKVARGSGGCAQPRNINDGKESWQQSF